MNNQAFQILSELIKEHNQEQWALARIFRRKPDLLPALVSIQNVAVATVEPFPDDCQRILLDVTARFRPYYSRRRAGERKMVPPPKMEVGRIHEGQVKLELVTSSEGRDYTIEFPSLKLKVET